MNSEHITPVKCDLCGEPLGINNMYPGGLCEHCFWATSLISNLKDIDTSKLHYLKGFIKEEEK